jgi:exodeoxyribonuclease V alpha subunit
VTGIGPKRAGRIVAGWAEQKVIREIMLFLHANGVGTSRAVRIFKTYGQDAVQIITENPYHLARDGECQGSCRLNPVMISPNDDAAGLTA